MQFILSHFESLTIYVSVGIVQFFCEMKLQEVYFHFHCIINICSQTAMESAYHEHKKSIIAVFNALNERTKFLVKRLPLELISQFRILYFEFIIGHFVTLRMFVNYLKKKRRRIKQFHLTKWVSSFSFMLLSHLNIIIGHKKFCFCKS